MSPRARGAHNAGMWRILLLVILAAGLGSLAATLICAVIPGVLGPGAIFESLPFMFNFSLLTMLFTVPGATLLMGLQARLQEREPPGWFVPPVLMVTGGVAGALIFLVLNFEPIWVGALYGASTAVALLLVERLPGFSPSAAR